MKNARIQPLVVLTCIFVLFTAGLFHVRTQNPTPVHIQKLPVSVTPVAVTEATDASVIININTATSEQLQTLPGIGPVLAERIVVYRAAHGNFESVGALMHVEGIGETKLEAIWELVTTGG